MDAAKKRNLTIILILGALSTISPFSIDMYLAAFPQLAADLHTTVAQVSLSVSSYFIGLAIGQIAYGPLLDHFGRKKPLYAGLTLFVIACAGCMMARSVTMLIAFRFLQALGGCVASVGSMAMVRDFFPVKDSAKVFSLLILILGVSPLLAPTVGSIISTYLAWQWIFALLAAIVIAIMGAVYFFLPEGHTPDPEIRLEWQPVIVTFYKILITPQFAVCALTGAFSFSGLFAYVAGSPLIFMDVYHVSAKTYGGIFAGLAVGFIGSSQLNILLSKYFSNLTILKGAIAGQALVSLVFVVGLTQGWIGLYGTIAMFFLSLGCLGLVNPNGAALSLAPFAKNAGSASALLGFLQIGLGALASSGVGLFDAQDALPVVAIMAGTVWIAGVILFMGRRHVVDVGDAEGVPAPVH